MKGGRQSEADRPTRLLPRPRGGGSCIEPAVSAEPNRNGFGQQVSVKVSNPEYIGVRSELGELKHLSTRRKGHQPRLRQ